MTHSTKYRSILKAQEKRDSVKERDGRERGLQGENRRIQREDLFASSDII